jgi:hypothetical protein
MSPDLLSFLFLITSTAIVLGVAVTLRGLFGLVGGGSPRLPEPSPSDASGNDAGSSAHLDGAPSGTSDAAAGGAAPAMLATSPATAGPVVRDMREPLVMIVGGVFIVSGGLIALATLIHSA